MPGARHGPGIAVFGGAMDKPRPEVIDLTPLTCETALLNARRLLRNAELETNLATMERLEKLADSWVNIAGLLAQRERP